MSLDISSKTVGSRLLTCVMQDSVVTHAREARDNRELARTIVQDSAKLVLTIHAHESLFFTLAGEGSAKDTYDLNRARAVLHKNAPVRTQEEIKSLTGVSKGIGQGLTIAKLQTGAVAVRAVADAHGKTARQLVSEWKTLDDVVAVLGVTHEDMRQHARDYMTIKNKIGQKFTGDSVRNFGVRRLKSMVGLAHLGKSVSIVAPAKKA